VVKQRARSSARRRCLAATALTDGADGVAAELEIDVVDGGLQAGLFGEAFS
jgi:hypothetical protein